MTTAVAYLRRSADRGNGGVSFDVQHAHVMELAARHGDPDPEVIEERGKSGAASPGAMVGTGRGGKRKAWLQLRERIAAGDVTAVYAYSLSRLARSTRELLELAADCRAHGVRVHLSKEGTLDFHSATGEMYLTVLAAVATFEATVASERGKDRTQAMRDAGKYIGRPSYGYRFAEDGTLERNPETWHVIEDVLATFANVGTNIGTARDLNARDVPARQGGRWTAESVAKVVLREQGSPRPRYVTGKSGSPTIGRHALSRLLYCAHCERMLTSQRRKYTLASGKPKSYVQWTCMGAATDKAHPLPHGRAEGPILAQLKAEAEHMAVAETVVRETEAATQQLAELAEQRGRLVEALQRGTLTNDDVDARIEALDAERERLETVTSYVDVPQAVDWDWEPAALNDVLHALWERVTVDLQAQTVEPVWRHPTLYQHDDQRADIVVTA